MKTEVVEATVQAADVAKMVMGGISEIVRDEVRHVQAKATKPVSPFPRQPYIEPPTPKLSNYAEVINKRVEWQKGKRDRLGCAWLCYPSSKRTLLVEQYGLECSMLERDMSVPRAVWVSGVCITPGKSVWTRFETVKMTLERALEIAQSKGWVVYETIKKAPPVQLELVERS